MAPRLVLASALLGLLAATPLAGRAADAARPLRTLSYAVDVRIAGLAESTGGSPTTRVTIRGPGGKLAQVDRDPGGSGERDRRTNVVAKGTVSVEVLQATEQDSGLVVDVSESTDKRSHATVRMAVAADGAVLYDPLKASDVTEEELTLVRWLARGFYGDHPTEPGTSWTVDQSANGHSDVERYRVVARDAQRVTLDYGLEEAMPGAAGYQGTRTGSLVYDVALSVPVKATFQGEARRTIGAAYDRTRTQVTLTLTADSFAAHKL